MFLFLTHTTTSNQRHHIHCTCEPEALAKQVARVVRDLRETFAHNGFGQDADWMRANFTNAEEILSVGYSQWVDAQVGYDLTNGLYNDPAYADIFEDKVHDWSAEDGRGFYETEDMHGVLIEHLLMNGIDRSEEGIISVDIPSGSVRGYPKQPRHSFDKP